MMETYKFKTNIKCGNCIATVTPFLNGISDIQDWSVDTKNPDKTLTVTATDELDTTQVISELNKAGYQAETIL
jgi:copper chaperone